MSDTLASTHPGENSGGTGPAGDGKRSWTERLVAQGEDALRQAEGNVQGWRIKTTELAPYADGMAA